jgi:excinuclease ABC subunit C
VERGRFKPQLAALPARPGTYLFKDGAGKVLYVGKASSLRNRVRSYFGSPHTLSPKIQGMVAESQELDFIVTDSEQEAIILENNLIKKHHPAYNVNLRDDKSYPYIKVCLNEEWPRVFPTRRFENDGGRYFGPYASARSVRKTLSLLKGLFRYCSPKGPITGRKPRPCFDYHIRRCAGACSGEIGRDEYRQAIDRVVLFLEGRHEAITRDLRKKMDTASAALEFEKAASVRDQLEAVERVSEEQKIISPRRGDEDVIGLACERDRACALVLFVRRGKLVGKEQFILDGTRDETLGQILASFVQQYYGQASYVPPQILLQTEPLDVQVISTWLGSRRGGKVSLAVPQRGANRRLVNMAAENAAQALEQMKAKWMADASRTTAALDELVRLLDLPSLPERIECYDVSNISGTSAVGSMVVFENGRPKSSEYRRFKIKGVTGIDDYAMMQELLRRRFKKVPEDGSAWASRPDLVLIDGGKGHLAAALHVLGQAGRGDTRVASIAKENEEVFIPGAGQPLALPRDSQALYLLQRVRDESHRFALSYHARLRRKASVASVLDVPGIGPKRRRALMKHFGSIRAIRDASVEEVASVPGMTRPAAEMVKEHL